jgi:hypothetical protein
MYRSLRALSPFWRRTVEPKHKRRSDGSNLIRSGELDQLVRSVVLRMDAVLQDGELADLEDDLVRPGFEM